MWKRCLVTLLCSLSATAWADGRLTETESRWLAAMAPVVVFARQQLLPLDIVIQPQNAPGEAPVAMGFLNGRCKLVMSFRGNPSAEAMVESIPQEVSKPVAEAIAAHEVAHCWRQTHGGWGTGQAEFIPHGPNQFEERQSDRKIQSVQETRREEGFADLVALAWTLDQHADQYAKVHEWFVKTREYQPVPGSHHDTRAWLKLAEDPGVFERRGTPFEQVVDAWKRGLAETADD